MYNRAWTVVCAPRLMFESVRPKHAKRTDIHKILIIGSGPIVIGQACEFDYFRNAGV